jgi:hypothetical protein
VAQRKDTTACLVKAACSYLLHKKLSCHTEIGLARWGRRRADVLAVSLRSELTIVEIKSSLADMNTDKKWHLYVPCCNKMYFAVTESTYAAMLNKGHIDKIREHGVGVLVLSPRTGYLFVKVIARRRTMDNDLRNYLITRLAWRGGTSKRNSRRTRVFLDE